MELRDVRSLTGMSIPTHTHRFIVGTGAARRPLVLLHGSHGNESDLMALAAELAPGAARLGIRGTVDMNPGHAFFHRRPDRSVDEADLATRAPKLAEFIATACASYGIANQPVAVGFSNGAIMAAALLMTQPDLLAGAILFRPLLPFSSEPQYRLDGTPVLIVDGAKDTRRSPGDGLQLARQLRHAGAAVTYHLLPVGHAVTAEDSAIGSGWLQVLDL